MPKAYWIAHIDVSNPDGYKAYVAANAEPLRKYGAKFLVRGGQFEIPKDRSARAMSCSSSRTTRPRSPATIRPSIRPAIKLRTPHSAGDVIIIEGYDGPQPGG